ncbi:MAG: HEPN domain-containing protein [Armatimonadota bacterium]|nr:HEPN domain-containing protein [Armatimonadota bacterium]
MNAPSEDVLVKVRQWVERADEDLRLARHALTMKDAPYRLVAYHAQQCAEKYLKAYLVARNVDFPYTHNIARLLELCNEHGGAMWELRDAEELTPFAITTRYPGEDAEVVKSAAVRAIEIAEDVCRVARVRLADLEAID